MEPTTALTTAGAIGLTVAGGVSALFLTVNQGVVAEPTEEPTPVVTEYVDQSGNPLSVAGPSSPIVIPAPAAAAPEPADEYALAHEDEEEAYEEEEGYEAYEEGEEGESGEYGAGGHVEDDDELEHEDD